ncbi:hypothetical protein VN97_g9073 [Penicillium thymicola]|uniref:Uncharacterized protein n=1 Tax=Penicillium thymicola TaxID=293382 RepID=A0AAI9X5K3_PENTH|nr:hypothetical protein VN97_g9073 [Penicillium thymicola]
MFSGSSQVQVVLYTLNTPFISSPPSISGIERSYSYFSSMQLHMFIELDSYLHRTLLPSAHNLDCFAMLQY